MKVQELVEKLNLKVLSGEKGWDREIEGCYVSDLLSDVMGNADAGNIWITLQTHKNVMAVASLKELACIILVKDFAPNEDTINQSNEEEIPILQTSMETFEVTGRVYEIIKSENLKNWKTEKFSDSQILRFSSFRVLSFSDSKQLVQWS